MLQKSIKTTVLIAAAMGLYASALAATEEQTIEEVIVVGTQIKGAKIAGALPVSVITAEDIEAFGTEISKRVHVMDDKELRKYGIWEMIKGTSSQKAGVCDCASKKKEIKKDI